MQFGTAERGGAGLIENVVLVVEFGRDRVEPPGEAARAGPSASCSSEIGGGYVSGGSKGTLTMWRLSITIRGDLS